jgi:hypothetical protein
MATAGLGGDRSRNRDHIAAVVYTTLPALVEPTVFAARARRCRQ